MKKAIISLAILFVIPLQAEILPTLGLGEEKVRPLVYPKLTFIGDYGQNTRFKSRQNSNIQKNAPGKIVAGLGIEVGVLKYLNAGFDFTFRPGVLKGDNLSPLGLRFPLFLKPYFPITDRFAISMKLQAGPALTLMVPSTEYLFMGKGQERATLETYRGREYSTMAYGFTSSAAFGVDVFPWSRIGFSLQWGVRYDMYRANINKNDYRKNMPDEVVNDQSNAPSGLSFSMMDFPATFTLHLIL